MCSVMTHKDYATVTSKYILSISNHGGQYRVGAIFDNAEVSFIALCY